MNDLSEGIRVNMASFENGPIYEVGPKGGIKEMVVSMEAGQYGAVPWIKVYHDNGEVRLINCEKLAVVDLPPIVQPTSENRPRA